MTNFNHKKIFAFLVSSILFTPLLIFAQGSTGSTIQNPLTSNSVTGILGTIMNLVATVGGVVVVFFIIFSGYKFVTAGSSDTDRTDAKKMFYATVIGGAILLGADVIANVVIHTVNCTVGRTGATSC